MEKNKLIVGLLFGTALLITAGFIAFTFGFKTYQQNLLNKASHSEAQMMLLQLRTHLLVHHISTESYENVDFSEFPHFSKTDFITGVVSTGPDDTEGFWSGNVEDASLIAKAKEVCPDCRITAEGFKVIALGKINDEFFAQTITHEEDAEVITVPIK